MANEKIVQIPLANVARVELVTEETTPKTYVVDTANEMKLEAFVSEGEEKELRKLNRLLAQLKTEDLTKGYDLTMKDMVMSPPVFALVDGGVSTTGAEGKFEGYTGPKMGEVVNRTPFTVNIYESDDCVFAGRDVPRVGNAVAAQRGSNTLRHALAQFLLTHSCVDFPLKLRSARHEYNASSHRFSHSNLCSRAIPSSPEYKEKLSERIKLRASLSMA